MDARELQIELASGQLGEQGIVLPGVARGDVNGGNVALAIFTGKSGKEGTKDDYKVTLLIECQ